MKLDSWQAQTFKDIFKVSKLQLMRCQNITPSKIFLPHLLPSKLTSQCTTNLPTWKICKLNSFNSAPFYLLNSVDPLPSPRSLKNGHFTQTAPVLHNWIDAWQTLQTRCPQCICKKYSCFLWYPASLPRQRLGSSGHWPGSFRGLTAFWDRETMML